MIEYKTPEEVEIIRENCLLVSKTLALVAKNIRPGVSGLQLDSLAEEFIRDHGAKPAFKGYPGKYTPFPGTLCISPNAEVVHGIPNDKPFKEGDVVSVDCGVDWNGYFGDAAYTFLLGDVEEEVVELCKATKHSLDLGIQAARVGNKIGDIGFAIQNYLERQKGYGVIREMVGHGLGRNLHEPPEVPNYGRRGKGELLRPGLVIAIEPMVGLKTRRIKHYKDGWTVKTRDQKTAAHYEHTICVTKKGPDRLSDHKIIEEEIKNNDNIMQIGIKS